jgi:K+-transporting ATPase ATPase A chain
MTADFLLRTVLFFGGLAIVARPLGRYMARVYDESAERTSRIIGAIEARMHRVLGIDARAEQTWHAYAESVLVFSFVGFLGVYAFQRLQSVLPLNPEGLAAVSPDSSFNTAVSFVTNTNWQGYGGESTMSHLSQMSALSVQNFLSAAVGMAVLAALIRSFRRECSTTIGNFWVDLYRGVFFILLPLSFVLAIALVSQGVVQNFGAYRQANLVEPIVLESGESIATQTIPTGPAASQIAIKQLGTNGGGFFNTNSAHPFENPTPFSNFLEVMAILLIPAALCLTFGEMVGDRRQGYAILAAMLAVFLPILLIVTMSERSGNPALAGLGIDMSPSASHAGGNMEGKETRFGVVDSALWAVSTTAASNGSVNSMHDSYTPIGGLFPMWLIQIGEVIFGGVGSGLYGMIVFAIVAVFVSGLMVGRTPEYLGKKIGAFEIKMAALAILFPCAATLLGTAIALMTESGQASLANPGPHGFSEMLYAFSSAANNNGSAFAGLSANTPMLNGTLGVCMLIGRFFVMMPVLAIAGSLAGKKSVPVGPGTLPTHTPLFVGLLVAVVILVGALSFFPALALGPIVEQLQMMASVSE